MTSNPPWAGSSRLSRRQALQAGGAGILSFYLAACGDDGAGDRASGEIPPGERDVAITYDFGYAGTPGSMQRYWRELQNRLSDGSRGVRISDLAFVDERGLLPRLQAQHAAKRGPTLETYFSGWNTYIFLNQGVLEPLDEYVGGSEQTDRWLLKREVDDRHYLMPFVADSAVLFANTAHLRKAGVEYDRRFESWQAFADGLRKVKRAGTMPVVIGASDGLNLDKWTQAVEMEFLQSQDQLPRVATGKLSIDEPFATGWAERLEELRVDALFNDDAAEITEQQAIKRFLDGEAAFILTFAGSVVKADNAADFEIAGYWQGDAPYSKEIASAGSGLIMTNYGKNKEAAGRLLGFMQEPEQLKLFNELTGELPPNRDFDTSGLNDLQTKLFELISEEPPWPHDSISNAHLTAIWDAARLVVAGESAANATAALDERLEKYREQNQAEIGALEKYAEAVEGEVA